MNKLSKRIMMTREGKRIWDEKMSEPIRGRLVYEKDSKEAKKIKSKMTSDDISAIMHMIF